MSSILSLDLALLKLVNVRFCNAELTAVMLFITEKTNWYPLIVIAAVLLIAAGRRLPHRGSRLTSVNPRTFLLGLILTVALSDQTAGLLKDSVHRLRPCRDPQVQAEINCYPVATGRRSFPSNHAANTSAVAVFTALAYPPLAVPAALLPVVIGLSRVYLGVHYPSDVVAGWLLGSLAAILTFALFRKRLPRPGIIGFANMFRFRQKQFTGYPGGDWKTAGWRTLDGLEVRGWFLEGGDRIVVFIHGLGGSALSRVQLAEELREAGGFSFLAVPLRGSDGHPVKNATGGVDEVHDILGALRFVRNIGFDPRRTVLYCTSMGGSSAIKACALAGRLLPGGLVVHGAFRDFFLSARRRIGLSGKILLRLLMPRKAVWNMRTFRPVYWLEYLKGGCRIEYIYGERDRTCPPEEGRLLAEACRNTDYGFRVLAGRGHPSGKACSGKGFSLILNGLLNHCIRNETG